MNSQKDIFFSVIIPCYNGENFVKRAIKSAFAQICKNYEIIVVDDGSTDKTAEILKNINGIKVITQANKGNYPARNAGLNAAGGNYISWLDADDEFLPDFLETVSGLIKKFHQCGMFATAYEVKKTNKTFVPKYAGLPKFPWDGIVPSYFKAALGYHPLSMLSTVVKKEVYDNIGTYKETMKSGADTEFWVRAAAQYKIAFTSKVCAVYHRDLGVPTLSNWGKKKNVDMSVPETLKKIISSKNYLPEDNGYIQEFLAKRTMDTAEKYLKMNDAQNAKKLLGEVRTKKFILRKMKLLMECLFK